MGAGKTHSSSLEEYEADKVRAHIERGSRPASQSSSPAARAPQGIAPKIDLSHISKPGDVLKAVSGQEAGAGGRSAEEPLAAASRGCCARARSAAARTQGYCCSATGCARPPRAAQDRSSAPLRAADRRSSACRSGDCLPSAGRRRGCQGSDGRSGRAAPGRCCCAARGRRGGQAARRARSSRGSAASCRAGRRRQASCRGTRRCAGSCCPRCCSRAG